MLELTTNFYKLVDRNDGEVYDVFTSSLDLEKIQSLEKQAEIKYDKINAPKNEVLFDLIKKEDSTFQILHMQEVEL